ncbi:hypothetical protein S83_068999 [Arachis hypogaea]
MPTFKTFPTVSSCFLFPLCLSSVYFLQKSCYQLALSAIGNFRYMSRMCCSVDVNEKETIFLKRNRKRVTGTWSLRLPKDPRLSPVRFLLRLGAKVASVIRVASMRRRSSRKVSSSSSASSSIRPRPSSDNTDSHRAKAVQDCIEFLHSSSSRESLS